MNNIYDEMIKNNLKKINEFGFNYDPELTCVCDNRFCQAIFSVPSDAHFTDEFYDLVRLLEKEPNGITYNINNNDFANKGTFHFTFMQQLSFNNYYKLPENIIKKSIDHLSIILKKHLPFTIHYNKLIAVQNGLVLCSSKTININEIRDEYRDVCKLNNIPLIEPYYLNIIHSTLFRFVDKENVNFFWKNINIIWKEILIMVT